MPPHSTGSGTISFGLVSIPVRMYTATSPGGVSFNLLHAKCGSRIRQQTFCPTCNEVVERSALVRGFEFAKDQYARVTDEELKGLEGEASKIIDITEFVPLEKVDPIYFERTYFLGPDKGGEKPYRLLADALARAGKVALASFVMRGKESLVLIRAAQGGLMMHAMYFADEVRSFADVDKGETAKIREGELELAVKLIDGLSQPDFEPQQYKDEYRARVMALIEQKVAGKEVTTAEAPAPRPQVIDLMEALRASLAKGPARERKPLAKAAAAEADAPASKPARAAAVGSTARRAAGKK
jgi:DNA end-binding protein Ku